jgi:esterase/lipase
MKIILLLLSAFLFQVTIAQKNKIVNNESTVFEINNKQGKIEFMVLDTAMNTKKPIFLWCQGSLPIPLYINYKSVGLHLYGGGITNFEYNEIKKHYHLVVISMPETPLIVDEVQLNDSYWYYGDSKDKNIPSLAYQNADNLDNYTNRALTVLKFLKRKEWVDNTKLIVVGHSQGGQVATKIAVKHKGVTKLALTGTNLFGRIDQNIRQSRKNAEQNKVSWEQADKEMEQQYQFYQNVNNPLKNKNNPNLRSWQSFSKPLINDWLTLNIPIYMAYGTADVASDLCDLVPLYFIRENKTNLSYKRYLNLEHNYFEINKNGDVDYDKPHWIDVMDAILNWSLKI